MINPYLQLQRTVEEARASTLLQMESKLPKEKTDTPQRCAQPPVGYNMIGNKIEDSLIGFGRWFLFCQRCRHGGHSSCVSSWFEYQKSREVSVLLFGLFGYYLVTCIALFVLLLL